MNVEENYDSDNMEGYPKAFTDDYSKKKAAPKQVFTPNFAWDEQRVVSTACAGQCMLYVTHWPIT